MAKIWCEFGINVTKAERNWKKGILLQFMKPVVKELEDLIELFHYLFEPKPDILFRIYGEEKNITKAVSMVEKRLEGLKSGIVSDFYTNPEYRGEEGGWGKEDWKIARECLCYSSKIALELIDKEGALEGKRFGNGGEEILDKFARYFSHLFFNQLGNTFLDEAYLHSLESLGRTKLFLKGSKMNQLGYMWTREAILRLMEALEKLRFLRQTAGQAS